MNFPHPYYLLCVALAVVVAVVFPVTRHLRSGAAKRQYYQLQLVMLVGAVVGAKLSVLVGDCGWPLVSVQNWQDVLWSGRSITGALILGFLCAEIAKPIMGYHHPPNDRFAAIIPFSIALGRVGCLVEGCCAGVPYHGVCALPGVDGIMRFPSQGLEIAFQLTVGIAFMILVRRRVLQGHLFAIYLMLYGCFRFFSEFMRATPKVFAGWSGYQWLSCVMFVLGAGFFLKRSLARPSSWNEAPHSR